MKRRWLFWLLVIIFVWVVVSRFAEIQNLAVTLARGQWQWVAVAALLQVLYYLVHTAQYRSAFDTVDVHSRLRDLLPVVFVSIFMNVAAPSGGASSAALFADDAARRGQSPGRAAVGALLTLVTDLSSFTLVLATGMAYLFLKHALRSYQVIGAILLLIMIGGMTGVLLMGLWQPRLLRRLLGWVKQAANRLAALVRRPPVFQEGWVEKSAIQFSDAAKAIRDGPRCLTRTLAIAILAHVVDIASLAALFLAFQQPVVIGVIVAGYAMGILFWVISITPQGIGVVEGVMALVYTSLGVPAANATVIALAFRGLSFWLPLVIGFILLRRIQSFGAVRRPVRRESWGVHAVAMLTALMGVINLLSAVRPAMAARLAAVEALSPLAVRHGTRLAAAMAGFALILLAGNLWRRKRIAWGLTLVVLVISSISHLIKGLDYEVALLSLALALWLFYLRPHFHARSDPPSIQQGLRVLVAAILFTLAYGAAGFFFLDRHFTHNFGLLSALRQTVLMFTQFYDPGLEPVTRFGRFFAGSIYTVGAMTMGYALLMLVRPVLVRNPASGSERARAHRIVENFGSSSLARFTLFDDKSYYFSPGGSVVAYALKGRGAVALGDPIGPPEDTQSAIAGFRDACQQNDWIPAFYQAHPTSLEAYRIEGFNTLCIGMEGIVHLDEFKLEGRANKTIRSSYNHMAHLGYRAELLQPPLSDELMEELESVSDEWLTMVQGTEKRFSVGWFEEAYIRSAPVMAVRCPEGTISAFANIVCEYQRDEVAVDLMRRRKEVEPATMDFLFVSLFQWAKQAGYSTYNLGLSALSGVGEHSDDPAVERALHYIYDHVNQIYNFKGLHRFKEKFHPEWSPRYLAFPGYANLPAVALAMVRADSGDSFLASYLKDYLGKRALA